MQRTSPDNLGARPERRHSRRGSCRDSSLPARRPLLVRLRGCCLFGRSRAVRAVQAGMAVRLIHLKQSGQSTSAGCPRNAASTTKLLPLGLNMIGVDLSMNRPGFTLVWHQGNLTLEIYGRKWAGTPPFTSYYQCSTGIVVFWGVCSTGKTC